MLNHRDAYFVAAQIAEVVKKEQFDIIMCGIESSDYNGSVVGGMISEFLGIPSVSAVSGIKIENGQPVMTREIDGGKEVVTVTYSICCDCSERDCQRTQNSSYAWYHDGQVKTC